jgi:hypothetical protein
MGTDVSLPAWSVEVGLWLQDLLLEQLVIYWLELLHNNNKLLYHCFLL